MNLVNFRFETDADGIATLTWDMPERSMNVITPQVMEELNQVVDKVAGDEAIKGCVIVSGKEAFSGGADLTMLQGLRDLYVKLAKEQGEQIAMQRFFDESRKLSQLYRKLETCGKPFAAAIHGVCLGGAFELALSCQLRVVSDDASTRVGLPEIKVGLFPGAGGTQRVSRLMQTGDALQMMFKGDQIKALPARNMGLVHAVLPRDQIVAAAKEWLKANPQAKQPWEDPKFKLPSNKVHSPAGMQIWPPASAIYRRETNDNYPAARAILSAVYEGLQLPMDLALKVESRYFAKILRTKEAASMIRSLFVSMQELNKGARRPADVPPSKLKKVGVVGAGFMGAGVAYVTALAGLEVVLVDRDIEAAEKGKAYSHKLVTDQITKGRAKTADRDALLGRIKASADYADLKGCDLIVEAVFEDPKVKAEVIAKVEAVVGPKTIFGSNTSTLPITGLAEHSERPKNFIGIHFFSPVEKMLLVEIIMAKKTGKKALALALDFVRAIKKTPIVVNDTRGFYANRCVGNYIREGHLMLMEGVPPAMIEAAGKQAGMPVGPLSLNDEVAVDLAYKVLKATKAQLGEASVDPAQEKLLNEMVEKHGRLGRKNRKGFYDYPEAGPKRLWPGLAELTKNKLEPELIDMEELKHRLLVTQALEAAKTYEEGVVTDPREADVGSIIGFGFAPYSGGTLSYIDNMGAAAFVKLCEGLAKKHGERFKPNRLLKRMAKTGESFYGSAEKKAAA
ncbi:3-hydroxyacyl-CoA dehydrogenase [Bosea sp. 62]|uniref:3-hydroxyacyl-CoA dehydrogenase NAD-binding domain-containing protein n=1 Tax=unclassified Bosea (in: a-proteobacteria) TaxID=2653178 RepID=UPI001256CDE2|nr:MULTISPECIES: 3-hydroxyacyl-CoA dehydrogenase NAD-binding domain-containing protein [unclassified Bosea (in: a-proteobacteria)]CAD5294543.1 3-hydroxyacyl-CoA dehydrogenase [Bosea sp. 7B]CAD5297825.1 3-hydroxyacyl-CoA dehydrogenase [Bosea sp. 21B]CAD5298025.1 3-hydroxyacyl-CoA dehydrogenase [Bosea sp. 46]VVT61352.1 3-hydroxyacyl-CoA dehydrogenase / enoyl-CoA hydratase / 3-hydroxybutyryl-CoA epimerase [Bosea sp. EC-HK365B]VXB18834.1 3-hydroxyacyl-CoA dehydrogenase [Bosea sp. 127]